MTDLAQIPVVAGGTTYQITGANLSAYFSTGAAGSKIVNGSTEANIGAAGGNANISVGGVSNVAVFATTGLTVSGVLSAPVLTTNNIRSDDSSFVNIEDGVNVTGAIVASGNITGGNISTGVITLTNSSIIKDTAGNAVAFGRGADAAGINAVAVGNAAGNYLQGNSAVAVGDRSGGYTQGISAVAVGQFAGNYLQSNSAVAIGNSAGLTGQGRAAVAIGAGAGATNQGNNSIIINATAANLEQTTANTFTVAPVRNDVANTGQVVFYNTTSKEITYGNVISVAGNVTGNYFIGNGSQLTGISTSFAGEMHVSKDGNDSTGTGTILRPYLTITHALTQVAGGRNTIVMHPGEYTENPTITSTNTQLITYDATGASTIVVGTVTMANVDSRIAGLRMANLIIAGNSQAYISGSTVTEQFTKSSSGYVEVDDCELQVTGNVLISGSGSISIVGNKINNLVVNNAGAAVLVKGADDCVMPQVTAGSLNIVDSVIRASSNTANAVTASAGTVVTLMNNQIVTPAANNVARVSIAGFHSIISLVYDKANSTLSNSLNSVVYFQTANVDSLVSSGNVTSGNVLTGGLISATGNITSANTLNGAGLSLSGNVVSALVSAANITTTANISGGNILTGGLISATGNITGGNVAFGGSLTGTSMSTTGSVTFATTLSNISIGTGQLAVNTTIGGPSQTGFITVGQSTASQTVNIANGATSTGNTKTLSVGENGLAGSTTNINIGPVTATTAAGLVTFNTATRVAIANTGASALSVAGNVTGGNVLFGTGVVSGTGNITGGNLITGALTSTASLSVTGNTATITSANYSIGYLNIPQISFAANATSALVDSGKHYYTTSASNLTLTLADNSAVSWPVGTALSIVNRGTANVTVAPAAGVSLYVAGNSTSANRIVTTYGMATVMNVAANIWMINGTVV